MRDLGMLVAVACGGAIGAVARFTIAQLTFRHLGTGFPWGTLVANVAGCFLIGIALSLAEQDVNLSPHFKAAIVTGFLGALTTFSTFGWETVSAAQHGHFPWLPSMWWRTLSWG